MVLICLNLKKKLTSQNSFSYWRNLNSTKDKEKANDSQLGTQSSELYAQTSRANIKNIIKIKDNFPKLSTKKIEEVHKVFNKFKKNKPRFNIMIKNYLENKS